MLNLLIFTFDYEECEEWISFEIQMYLTKVYVILERLNLRLNNFDHSHVHYFTKLEKRS